MLFVILTLLALTKQTKLFSLMESSQELLSNGPNYFRFTIEEDKILINYLDHEVPDLKLLEPLSSFWEDFIPTNLLPGRSPFLIRNRYRELKTTLSLHHLEIPECVLNRLELQCACKESDHDQDSSSDSLGYISPPERPQVPYKDRKTRFGSKDAYSRMQMYETPRFGHPESPRSDDSLSTSVSQYIEWTAGETLVHESPNASDSDGNTSISNKPYLSWAKGSSIMKNLGGSEESNCSSISNIPFEHYSEELKYRFEEYDDSTDISESELEGFDIRYMSGVYRVSPTRDWYRYRKKVRVDAEKRQKRKEHREKKRSQQLSTKPDTKNILKFNHFVWAYTDESYIPSTPRYV